MRLILFISFFIVCNYAITQSNYYFGYQEGFKYGCRCIDIPPKNVAFYNGSYDEGYLDGKVDGLIYFNANSNKPSQQNSGIYSKPHDYSNRKLYSSDFELMERVLYAR